MAQKATKQLAARNTASLTRLHIISLCFHALFLLLRIVVFRSSFTLRSLILYIFLGLPTLAIEAIFELNSRPRYQPNGDLKSAGEDLEQGGVTEWLWDVLYWSWGCITFAAVFGDRAWWGWVVVPLYSGWLAWTTFAGVRNGMGMGQGSSAGGADGAAGQNGGSKRQEKMEKRGGQKMKYR